MALACRAFLDPALDVLWFDLLEPDPLIQVLPRSKRGEKNRKSFCLIAAPTDEEWERFNYYARRVHELYYSSSGCDDVWCNRPRIGWRSILRFHPGGPLLPNLRSFESDDFEVSKYYHLFVHSPLCHLVVDYWVPDEQTRLIRALPKCKKTLETLMITTSTRSENDPDIDRRLSGAMSQMEVLVNVDVKILLPQAVSHLATLSSLRELSFTISPEDNASTSKLPFHALEQLSLETHSSDVAPMRNILQRLAAPFLQDLSLYYNILGAHDWRGEHPNAAYVRAVVSAIPPLEQLQSFAFGVRSYNFTPSAVAANVLHITDISPLLTHRSLKCVVLNSLPISLQAVDIEPIAHAWPHATSIKIGESAPMFPAELQLYDLLPLAQLCPSLTSLSLPLSIPASFSAQDRPRFGTSRSPLWTLQTGSTDIAFSAEAAVFLACVFPKATLHAHRCESERDDVRRINETKTVFVKAMEEELDARRDR
ncbi:hypothetical protein PsYK624_011670 [Phanerochaete sordida]|uniref:F-box domain-containing protein n=1 Tax=Phanerochaete sordida TaxID=48140 RepID=A0A9P3L7L0_9APHY|nr:hypothetical protein PsYK624_011670 [Phanerochaete sordida]